MHDESKTYLFHFNDVVPRGLESGQGPGHRHHGPQSLHALCRGPLHQDAHPAGRQPRRANRPPRCHPECLHTTGERQHLRLRQLRPQHRPRDQHLHPDDLVPQRLQPLGGHHPFRRLPGCQQPEDYQDGTADGIHQGTTDRRPDLPRHNGGLLQRALLHRAGESTRGAGGHGRKVRATRHAARTTGPKVSRRCGADAKRPRRATVPTDHLPQQPQQRHDHPEGCDVLAHR